MSIATIGNHLPQLNLNAANAVPKLGTVLLTTLAINALSNLPKSEALGHVWKSVDKECYEYCKEFHSWSGQICFWICMAKNDKFTPNN